MRGRESLGATCILSPSDITDAGRAILKADPHSTGSLGIAIGEAVEQAMRHDETKYALGSVLNGAGRSTIGLCHLAYSSEP